MIRLSETFLSIQGEGPMQGRPALFIRLAGCNLKCSFCDTPYAQQMGSEQEFTPLRDEMVELSRQNGLDFMFVFTGGEPLLQQGAIEQLLGMYFARVPRRANAWFETNGTIVPNKTLVKKYRTSFVVSPKFGHINRDALKALSDLGAHFKFVINEVEKDTWWYSQIALAVAKEFGVPKDRIWLQPMAKDKRELEKVSKALWHHCAELGVNFSPRTHIWLHGKKRGV
jgi:organic radical activating enzyme